jgi:hypothetical protein
MNTAWSLLGGFGLGAGLMYLFDPQQGRRRRALVRDKAVRAAHQAEEGLGKLRRDLANRVSGLAAESKTLLTGEEAPDAVLVERVRSKLGRVVSHPHAIRVQAANGRVALSGPILAAEAKPLLDCVSSVAGVKEVENRLDVHQDRGRLSALQGGRERTGEHFDLLQKNWSPTTRLLVGMAGGALTVYGLTRAAPLACLLGTAGLALIAGGLTNTSIRGVVDESACLGSRLAQAAGLSPTHAQHEEVLGSRI